MSWYKKHSELNSCKHSNHARLNVNEQSHQKQLTENKFATQSTLLAIWNEIREDLMKIEDAEIQIQTGARVMSTMIKPMKLSSFQFSDGLDQDFVFTVWIFSTRDEY